MTAWHWSRWQFKMDVILSHWLNTHDLKLIYLTCYVNFFIYFSYFSNYVYIFYFIIYRTETPKIPKFQTGQNISVWSQIKIGSEMKLKTSWCAKEYMYGMPNPFSSYLHGRSSDTVKKLDDASVWGEGTVTLHLPLILYYQFSSILIIVMWPALIIRITCFEM